MVIIDLINDLKCQSCGKDMKKVKCKPDYPKAIVFKCIVCEESELVYIPSEYVASIVPN